MPRWAASFRNRTGIPLPSFRILANLIRYKPDVVVMEGMSNIGNNLLCIPFILARKIPFVWWSLGHIPSQSHTLRARIGVPLHRWFLKHAGSILAYSTFAKQYMESLGARPTKVHVVFNTLDERDLLHQIDDCKEESERLREAWGLSGRPVAVFAGTVHPGKKLDVLIHAFARVRQRMSPADPALVVIGDGPSLPACKDLVSQLGIERSVYFAGRQDTEASAYFLLGDVCILPGLGGLAINHAFTHGLPVICGRADGCEEDLVFTDKTGIRLDDVNADTLAEATLRMLSARPEAQRMGQNAHELVTKSVTMDNFADTVLTAAKEAAQDRNRRG